MDGKILLLLLLRTKLTAAKRSDRPSQAKAQLRLFHPNPMPANPSRMTHDIYAMRNLVERFFCRMKDMRRLTTRYEKLKRNFLAMVHIFAIRCWIN